MDREHEKLGELQEALDQGQAFQRLSGLVEFQRFRAWMEKAIADYEKRVHSPEYRQDGVALARFLEGHAALGNLLTNFDRAIDKLPALRKEQEEIELGITNPNPNGPGRVR